MDGQNSVHQWLWVHMPDPILWAALVLILGTLAGEWVARSTQLPRVVGYTLAGCAAAVAGFGPGIPLQGYPKLIIDLGLALLLFEIGSRTRLVWLRHNLPLLLTSLGESLLSAVAVYATLQLSGLDLRTSLACAVLAMPASAAVAGRVAIEKGAQGQVTDRMNLLTTLNTLYAVLLMTVLRGWLETEQSINWLSALSKTLYAFFGSLLLAWCLARGVGAAARRLDLRNESAVLLVLGMVVLGMSLARWQGFSTLLVPLLAGLIMRNTTQRPWAWPRHCGTAGGVLVLVMFVLVGASWSLPVLAAGGALGAVVVVVRAAAKLGVVMGLSRWSGISLKQGAALGITLMPLSAVVLVMLSDLNLSAPQLGQTVTPIMLSALAMLELAGPLAVHGALKMSREFSETGTRKETRA